jgi:hypothetical protein
MMQQIRKVLILFCVLISFQIQGQVLLDDFNRVDNSTVGGGWTEIETGGLGSGASLSSNKLQLSSRTSSGAAGRTYVYKDVSANYVTTPSQNPRIMTWLFNMQQGFSNPDGFNLSSTVYGNAFVLGSTTNNFLSGSNGYAVVLGRAGTPDHLRLVYFTNGLNSNLNVTDIIQISPTFSTEYLSIKVTFDPSTNNWRLYYRNDNGTFANPNSGTYTIGGTGSNNVYTNSDLKYIGCHWNYGSGLNQTASFDNIYIPNNIIPPGCTTNPTPASGTINLCPTSGTNLSWSAGAVNDGIAGYKIYFGTDGGGIISPSNIQNGFSNGLTTSYSTGSLSPNTTYYWQAVPFNHGGSASGCAINSFTTGADAATGIASVSPAIINSCVGGTTDLTLSSYTGTVQWQYNNAGTWTNIAGATTSPFTVTPAATTDYRAVITSSACGSSVNSNITTVTVKAVYALTAASSYYESFSSNPSCWTIQQINGTATWSFVTTMTNPSFNPVVGSYMAMFNSHSSVGDTSNLISPVFDISDPSMTTPWISFEMTQGNTPSSSDKIYMYISTDGGLTWTSSPVYSFSFFQSWSNRWVKQGWINMTAYTGQNNLRIKFSGISKGGNNIGLDEFYFMNLNCPNAIALAEANITPTGADLSWNVAADSSQVRYRLQGSTPWLYYTNGNFTISNSATISQLVPSSTFEWQVSSWCESATLGWSPTKTFTTAVSSPATGLTVSAISAGKATLFWNAVPGVLKYRVQLSVDGGSTWNNTADVTTTTKSYGTLTSGTTYQWRVTTIYGFSYAIPVDVSTGPSFTTAGCTASGLTVSNLTKTSAKLSWTAVPGATKYMIALSSNGGVSWSNFEVTTTSRTFNTLVTTTNYQWMVNTFCDNAYRGYTSPQSFVTPRIGVGVLTNTIQEEEIMLYPNPFSDQATIELPDSIYKGAYLRVSDIQGRMVMEKQNLIDTSFPIGKEFKTGTYILQLITSDRVKTIRFIKIN